MTKVEAKPDAARWDSGAPNGALIHHSFFETTSSSDELDTTGSCTNNSVEFGSSSRITRRSNSLLSRTLAPSRRYSNNLTCLTIDKLNFRQAGLVGRESETRRLQECLERLQKDGGPKKQLILLEGDSGTGKTALAKILRRPIQASHGLFAMGKYDQHQAQQTQTTTTTTDTQNPYAGIAAACGDLVGQILASNHPTLLPNLQKELTQDIGPEELCLLTQSLPILHEVLPVTSSSSSYMMEEGLPQAVSAEAKHRFHDTFRRFLRVVTRKFTPLCLVLDDLQWADRASLELMESTLSDPENHNLMMVALYRTLDSSAGLLSETIQRLETAGADTACTSPPALEVVKVPVGNLNFDAAHQFIVEVLSTNDSKALALAEVCHKRTMGNAFFLKKFLSSLHKKRLLEFQLGTMAWTWANTNELEQQTQATDNVVDLLRAQMFEHTEEELAVLQLAACLGASFEKSTLVLVWQNMEKLRTSEEESSTETQDADLAFLERALELFEAEGYLQSTHETKLSYQFTHDKIQEAAWMSISESGRPDYSRKVGKVLLDKLPRDELESAIFVVTNLLNDGDPTSFSSDERTSLAELNCRACRKSVALSAFDAAAQYAARGIALLGPHQWREDRDDLALNLYSMGAEIEAFRSNEEPLRAYFDAVVSQTQRPLTDKLRVHAALRSYVVNAKALPGEGAKMALDLLKQFGCVFPKRKVSIYILVARKILQVKRWIKNGRLDQIPSLRPNRDPVRVQLFKLLKDLATYLYQTKSDLLLLAIFKSLDWTLEYGLDESAAPNVATTGLVLAGVLGDYRASAACAKVAQDLTKNHTGWAAARTLFLLHTFVCHWTAPLHDSLKPLLHAYDLGLRCGDGETAFWSIHNYIDLRWCTGTKVDLLLIDTERYGAQMKETEKGMIYHFNILHSQLFLNLMGDTEDRSTLSGDVINEATVREYSKRVDGVEGYEVTYDFYQGYLFTHYGRHLECARLAESLGTDSIPQKSPGVFMTYTEAFTRGVSCFAAARQTGKRKYMKLARQCQGRIKRWFEKGNPNLPHMDSLLDAEFAAWKGNKHVARQKYQLAVMLSARGGVLLDAGLSAQRMGDYLLELGETEDAIFRLEQAVRYYREVGALGVADDLEEKHAGLLCHRQQTLEVVTINAESRQAATVREGDDPLHVQ